MPVPRKFQELRLLTGAVSLKELAGESGVPYQRLLNTILKESLGRKGAIESRIGKIERDLRKMKKMLAA